MSTQHNLKKTDSSSNALLQLITRLHFYVGLFVGPFIFVAALTGVLYIITPQLESAIYKDALTTQTTGEYKTLTAQIAAAKSNLETELKLFAVRPAPEQGDTTRIMFLDPTAGLSGARALFIDPVTLELKGNLAVYGTSGILPFRTTIDYLHRQLLLGEFGRYYSELAASWLWFAALGGVFLWIKGGKKNKAEFASRTALLAKRRRHGQLGLVIFIGLLFVSATGLTWSKWAGGNISEVRKVLGWVTPSVSLSLTAEKVTMDEHAEHNHHSGHATESQPPVENDQLFDQVLASARAAGIDAAKLEIKPPKSADKAWFVREIDRSWPSQVDSVAVDPRNMTVISRSDFETFPIVAKLIRWGIDAHMGILFGVANQIVLTVFGLSLCLMILWGYKMWWMRRPAAGQTAKPLMQAWSKMTAFGKVTSVVIALFLSICLPVMGVSLLVFLIIDAWRWKPLSH
ncbi:PepSY-associated TM helix domain-containing protein [Marinomonas algicola]|uniref:PepSY-associated TM helix domain-containing protein n=1 Tax=Marinomonas algicola TaxID=2773454 RepID=UPI00174E8A99|nr:PepSY-associated TM helix domain-containing protein [Marinomonas algicola]